MAINCPICELSYSEENKPKSIPCGHTLCEICINSLIKNEEFACPICRVSYKNLNISHLPTIYQLIITEKSIIDTADKANEVYDQINYLNYVKDQINFRYQELSININEIKKEVADNLSIVINKLNQYLKQINATLDLILQDKEKYTLNMIHKIQELISTRKFIMQKFSQLYSQQSRVTDEEKKNFLALDYPKFQLKFDYYRLSWNQLNLVDKFKEFIGEILKKPDEIALLEISYANYIYCKGENKKTSNLNKSYNKNYTCREGNSYRDLQKNASKYNIIPSVSITTKI